MSNGAPLQDGYSDVPAGKIAAVVTYLEMRARPAPRAPRPETADLALERFGPGEAARYKRIYRAIGERWFWFSRLGASDEEVSAVLGDPGVMAFAATQGGRDIGLVEIDLRQEGEAEIVYFGLVDEATGQGLGRRLMDRTLELAWGQAVRRVWLHTCTLDHPGAIAFYRRSGFAPYRLAVEVADDPRIAGLLDPDSFPDIPVTRGA
jgi:GNAT superfamily N-acetyltransferase